LDKNSDSHGLNDWVYLLVSVAASYYVYSAERGTNKHYDIMAAHHAQKMLRKVRQWVGGIEYRLQAFIDERLDYERTV
jgi:hypothetical protein